MASNSVLLALNSLSHDGIVCLTAKEHEQLGRLSVIISQLATECDDDSSGSDNLMECRKYLWLILLHDK